jgi:hypothetical protein
MQTADVGERNSIVCGVVCKNADIGTCLEPSSSRRG